MQDAAETIGDGLEEFLEIERGDQSIVHIEQHPQAVAFAREFFLVGLGSLEI